MMISIKQLWLCGVRMGENCPLQVGKMSYSLCNTFIEKFGGKLMRIEEVICIFVRKAKEISIIES